jgi:hypothetical protein
LLIVKQLNSTTIERKNTMATPAATAVPSTAVNGQITDSVTSVNTAVVGGTPAVSAGNLMMATSQALGTSAHNATGNNQQASITMQAATVQGINSLMAIGGSVIGRGAESILEKG